MVRFLAASLEDGDAFATSWQIDLTVRSLSSGM
jgi:hypothetical protein